MIAEHSWLSTKDVALLLVVSQRTVQNWVDDGKLKSSRTVGGHRRLNKEDVRVFLELQGLEPTSRSLLTPPAYQMVPDDTGILRVLVVEDDYNILRLCELHFAQFSVPSQLFMATNAYQGLMMIGKHQPHLIFTDLKMPHIDGLQMIREIHKLPGMKETKIIAVTGLETREIVKMGSLPDGLMVLPKPIPFKTVETILYQQANALNLAVSREEAVTKEPREVAEAV